jgi:hypothetical protein
MEKNMTREMKAYFSTLENYLGTKLYFYGSIHRVDYFQNCSDVDIDIFTPTPQSILIKLKHFFQSSDNKEKNIICILQDKIVKGIKFSTSGTKYRCEFSIYPEWSKENVLTEHLKKTNLPFIGICCLVVIKVLFYWIKILDIETYKTLKRLSLSYVVGYKEIPFIAYSF